MRHKANRTNKTQLRNEWAEEEWEEEEGDNDREEHTTKKLILYGTRLEHIFVRRRHIQFFPRFFRSLPRSLGNVCGLTTRNVTRRILYTYARQHTQTHTHTCTPRSPLATLETVRGEYVWRTHVRLILNLENSMKQRTKRMKRSAERANGTKRNTLMKKYRTRKKNAVICVCNSQTKWLPAFSQSFHARFFSTNHFLAGL